MKPGASNLLGPDGAPVLWEGRPGFRAAAFRIWHLRAIALYFVTLLADGALRMARGEAGPDGLAGEARLLAMGVAVAAMLTIFAWLTHRTTNYAITERHVIMRFGVGLPRKLVIPFGAIVEVKLRVNGDRTADIALRLKEGQGVMYLKLWPHVRRRAGYSDVICSSRMQDWSSSG